MAQRPTADDHNVRRLVTEAADMLRSAGDSEHADAVARTVTREWWPALGRLLAADDTQRDAPGTTMVQMKLSAADRDHIKAAAAESGIPVRQIVEEGFRAYLAGEFTPRPQVRARRGGGEAKVPLITTADEELTAQVADLHEERPAHVAADWLLSEYGLGHYSPEHTPAGPARGAQQTPRLPRTVRDALTAAAAAAGVPVSDTVDEGLRQFVAGEFEPAQLEWTAAEKTDMVALKMRPADELWAAAREYGQAEATAARLGWSPRPGHVAIDFLMHTYPSAVTAG